MGFFSGMTHNGLLEVLGRIARSGAGPFASASPATPPGGRGLADPLQPAMDPQRLAISQALLAGDFGAVSRMTEPLRQRRLAAREHSSFRRELPSQDLRTDSPYSAANPALRSGEAVREVARMPSIEQGSSPSFSKSDALKSAGQDDPVTRQMAPYPEPVPGQAVGEAIVRQALDTPVERENPQRAESRRVGDQFDAFFSQNHAPVEELARRRGVDPTLLLGLSALESDWGRSRMARDQNNPFGATPYGDMTGGVSYPSIPAAWGVWDSEWGARIHGLGSDPVKFVHYLAQDNRRSTNGVDRRGAYNPQNVKDGGDPEWKGKVLDTIDSVRRRYSDWLASRY